MLKANGAYIFVVAKLKDGSVKSESINLSLVQPVEGGAKRLEMLPPEWTDDRCVDFAKRFLTLEFWECQAKEQVEVMLSSMLDSTCEMLGGVEFIEKTSKSDKLSVIYAISLLPEIGSSTRTLDDLSRWNASIARNTELSDLLEDCSNRHHFVYIEKS